jgi:hypothetical protein
MTIRELEYQARRCDYRLFSALDQRLHQADRDRDVRVGILIELGFLPTPRRRWSKTAQQIESRAIDVSIVPMLVPALVLEGFIWCFGAGLGISVFQSITLTSFVFPFLAAVAAFQNWKKSRINSTVDDALKRKDITSTMIMSNPDVLLPYFRPSLSSPAMRVSSADPAVNIKIDMYIYSEIDNLEFVFDKSHHGLVDELFVMRAIKIFVARSQNRLFRMRARDLVGTGRYNHDFQTSAETIMLIGEWRDLYARK